MEEIETKKKIYKNNADTKWNKNFTVITVESPNDDLRRKYRDHPILPSFIESILSKAECIFFLALDTHVYT